MNHMLRTAGKAALVPRPSTDHQDPVTPFQVPTLRCTHVQCSVQSSPSSSPSSKTLHLTPISQSHPSSSEYRSRTSTEITRQPSPTSVSLALLVDSNAGLRLQSARRARRRAQKATRNHLPPTLPLWRQNTMITGGRLSQSSFVSRTPLLFMSC
jgi:hypothetical protein